MRKIWKEHVLGKLVLITMSILLCTIQTINIKANEEDVGTVQELKEAVNNANDGDIITLASGFIAGAVELVMPAVNVTIDGNEHIWDTGYIKVSGSGAGSLAIKDLVFDGTAMTARPFSNVSSNGSLVLDNISISNSTYGAVDISTSGAATTTLINNKISGNASNNTAPAVWVGANSNLKINQSIIEDNIGNGGGYECGAIASKNYRGNLEINNTILNRNINKCANTGVVGGGGGALSFHYLFGNIVINESYFEANETNGQGVEIKNTFDGGAVYILDGRDGATFTVDKTTFKGNIAHDDGGAMMIQGSGNPGLTTTITNSTFYGNKAYGLDGANYSGGAIQFFKNGGSSKMDNIIKSSTFVGNQAGNESSRTEQRGGAIGLSGAGLFASATVTNSDDIYVGNKVYNATGVINTASNYKDISNSTTVQAGTTNILNVDKGAIPTYTEAAVLGTNNAYLVANNSKIKAGTVTENIIIPTIPIKPAGIADNTYSGAVALPTTDQRNFSKYKDQGSVEMSWINYDANGGVYNLDPLESYIGDVYYEVDENNEITSYYAINGSSENENILAGIATLHISNDGKEFKGWSIDADATEADGEFLEGAVAQYTNDNLKLYAVWETPIETYTVTFESNGGTAVSPLLDVEADSIISAPAAPSKTGHDFAGWYKDSGLTDEWLFTTDVVTEDITLYAKWEPIIETYTVTFESNGGTAVSPLLDVEAGSIISAPAAPNKTGHDFAGWYKDSGLTDEWLFATDVVTEDITLYAKWDPVVETYTVTFESNGGSLVNPYLDIDEGAKITKPTDPSNPQYEFIGWFKDSELTELWAFDADVVLEDMTLYAKWKLVIEPIGTYTVTFESNGGTAVETILGVESGTIISEPTVPTKTGNNFVGWYKDSSLTETWEFVTDVVTDNMTLYAKWEPVVETYTVTFESNGGTAVASVVNVEAGTTILMPVAPTKKDADFAGWYKDSELTEAWIFTTDKVTENITLYAKWENADQPRDTYKVNFESNGGSDVPSIKGIEKDSKIKAPLPPTKSGYDFIGWYKDSSLTNAWNFDTDVVIGNMTLYAKWTITPPKKETSENQNNKLPSTGEPIFEAIFLGAAMISAGIGVIQRRKHKK